MMRRIFPLLLLLCVMAVCVGFYRGWFQLSTNQEPFSEKLDVHLQVDRDKMIEDAKSVKENTKALLNNDKAKD